MVLKIKNKRILTLVMAIVLFVTSIPSLCVSFAATEESVGIMSDATASETFTESCQLGDVVITVTAPEGVFPVGAKLEVKEVSVDKAQSVYNAVEEKQEEDSSEKNPETKDYLFDIKVIYQDEEIEPDIEHGTPNISFSIANAPENMVGAEIYHISDKDEDVTATISELASDSEAAENHDKASRSETTVDQETDEDKDYLICIQDAVIKNDDEDEIITTHSEIVAEEDELFVERLPDVSIENDEENQVKTISAEFGSFSYFLLKLVTTAEQTNHMIFDDDGHALPFVKDAYVTKTSHYNNKNTDVYRFCVYVETDHDTDGDGKNDLVKVFIQVPKAAAEGYYKAPVIVEPMPYSAGTIEDNNRGAKAKGYSSDGFDFDSLYTVGSQRPELDVIDSATFATSNKYGYSYKSWYYQLPYGAFQPEKSIFYSGKYRYAYYLSRGFAVVITSGIGTAGSEGFELCGLDLERDAIKCVVEWLAGKDGRTAYTDKDENNRKTRCIEADWSNHKVALTGQSYGGTLPFEVACTGVEGLETIIPFAGIASWYDYTNSQGMHLRTDASYTDHLSMFNSGGCFEDDDWTEYKEDYKRYLGYISEQETEADGNYTSIWQQMDYTKQAENIKCSGLIFHGVNDFNVTTKHADMMYQSFMKANADVRMILHQGAHQSPYGHWFKDGENSSEMINRWLCYYLLDLKEDVEIDKTKGTLADDNTPISDRQNIKNTIVSNSNGDNKSLAMVTWQDSSDPLVWHSEESWRNDSNQFNYRKFEYTAPLVEKTLYTDDYKSYWNQYWYANGGKIETVYHKDRDPYYVEIPEDYSARFKIRFENEEDQATEIFGSPKITLRIQTPVIRERPMLSAVLIDRMDNDDNFKSFVHETKRQEIATTKEKIGDTTLLKYAMKDTDANVISRGWIDLENPVDFDESEDRNSYATDYESRKAFSWYDYTIDMTPTAYKIEPGHYLELVLFPWDPFSISPSRPDDELVDEEEEEEWIDDEDFDNDDIVFDRYIFTIDVQETKINLPLTESSSLLNYKAYDARLSLDVNEIDPVGVTRVFKVAITDIKDNPIGDDLVLQLKYENGPYKGQNVDIDDYNAIRRDDYYEVYLHPQLIEYYKNEKYGNAELSVYVKDDAAKVYGAEGFDCSIPHIHEKGNYHTEIPATEDATGLKAHFQCKYHDCDVWLDTNGIVRDKSYFIINKTTKPSENIIPSRGSSSYSNGTLDYSNGKIRFKKSDGTYATNEWEKVNGKWYYFGSDGCACTGWLFNNGAWYFLMSNGVMNTGWQLDGDKWYYLKPDGSMAIGWIQDEKGNWYYLNTVANGFQGMMLTGWITDPVTGYKYYLDPVTGKMVTGTVVIDGKTYVFTSNPGEGRPIGSLKE